MKFCEDKVLNEGKVLGEDILVVDMFVNHQIDTKFARQVGEYFASEFKDSKIDRILTIETSGIAFAIAAAMYMNDIPVTFAKKSKSKIVDISQCYVAKIASFTRGTVSEVNVRRDYLKEGENILIVDDFLADGNASFGLIDICKQAGANVKGVAVVIDKAFQAGRKNLEAAGYKVVSCASIKEFKNGKVVF